MFKLDLEKAEEPEIKLPTSAGSLKKREFQKNICFIHYTNDFDCVDHNKLWKILQEMGIPDHLTCLLRNLYAGQEATVRTGHETTDWFQIGKGVHQGCKVHHEKTKIMASSPIISWQIYGETVETLTDFIFLCSKITAHSDCSHEIKRRLVLK